MNTSPNARGIAAALDELRDSIDDATTEYSLLNILSYALRTDRAGELETHLDPLMDKWLEQSRERLVVSDEQREDAVHSCRVETLEAYRSTIL